MELHLFTLRRLAGELHAALAGGKIVNCYTRQKNELTITVQPVNTSQLDVVISTDNRNPFVVWRAAGKQPRVSTRLMESIIGKEISEVDVWGEERVICISLCGGDSHLAIRLFRNQANVFLVEGEIIAAAFKRGKKIVGTAFHLSPADLLNPLQITAGELRREMADSPQMSLQKFLKRKMRFLNPTLVRELLFRLQMDGSVAAAELTEDELNILLSACRQIIREAEQGSPRIYSENELPVLFSLVELASEKNRDVQEYDSVNEALKQFLFKRQKIFRLNEARLGLKEKLSGKIQQARQIMHQLSQLPDEEEVQKYNKKIGELIIANMGQIRQVQEVVELTDYFDPELRQIKVRLNPHLSLKENAERYLKKAKEITLRRQEIEVRREELEGLLQKMETMLEQVEKAENERDLRKFENRLKELRILPTASERMAEESKPYRSVIFKGWEFWIGKNARSNDEMTFRYAHKDDWWLHAQGVAGSHVIVRNPKRLDALPKEIKEYGAVLAAKNSAARHSSYVPVMITRVKYVRKPRGAKPGTAIPERIKTIFVEPK